MATRLTNRWGDTLGQPTSGNLVAALTELEVNDPEHLACWLSDEDDWTISVFANGLVFLDHAQSEKALGTCLGFLKCTPLSWGAY